MQSTVTKISSAVAYTTIASTDLERADRFYRDRLGFDTERDQESGSIVVHCGKGTALYVYERPTPPNCDTTIATFQVDNLEEAMQDLEMNGVTFEEYDLPYLKTENKIAVQGQTKASWFKDPDGNILSLVQM